MTNIIIYGSHYGTTKEYADELSRRTKIQALPYEKIKEINNYDNIIYLGAVYAGGILGMSKTLNKLNNIANKNRNIGIIAEKFGKVK